MPRANPQPTPTAAPEHPAAESTIGELCREWRLVRAKAEYDVAALPAESAEDETYRLLDVATDRAAQIEEALAASEPETFDDAQAILAVVLKNMREENMGESRDSAMVGAVHQSLNRLRNQSTGGRDHARQKPDLKDRPVDEAAVLDLENRLYDLINMAGIVDDLTDGLFAARPDDGETYRFPSEQIDQFHFAITHVKAMLDDFRSRYYAAVGLNG